MGKAQKKVFRCPECGLNIVLGHFDKHLKRHNSGNREAVQQYIKIKKMDAHCAEEFLRAQEEMNETA